MRSRAAVPLLVVLGAAAIAGGALPRWWTVRWVHPMLGEQTTALTGRQSAPALLVIALVTVAGIGAVAAARGVLRRLVGLLVAAAGALAIVAVVAGTSSLPSSAITEANPQVERILGGNRQLIGPLISGFGGLLVGAGGLLVLGGAFAGRGMGDRFDRGGSGAAGPRAAAATGTARDGTEDDAAALWKSLDTGDDPTAGGAGPASAPAAQPPSQPPVDRPGGQRQ